MSSNTAAEHSTISYNNFLTIISEKSTELYIYCNCVYKMRKSSSVARRTKDIYTWMYCLPETMFWWGQVDCSSEFFLSPECTFALPLVLALHVYSRCTLICNCICAGRYRLVNKSISEGQKLHPLNHKHGWEGHENSYVLRKCSCMCQGGTSAIYIWSPPPEHMQQGSLHICYFQLLNLWVILFHNPLHCTTTQHDT